MGCTVAYPDQTFKAASILTALQDGRCTSTIFVPTTLQAVLYYRGESEYKFEYLLEVDFGGAMVSLKHLKQCIYSLGAKKVGTSFGMTEGSPLQATPVSDPNELIRGGSVIGGEPSCEARVQFALLGLQFFCRVANTASSIKVAPRPSNHISAKAIPTSFTTMKWEILGFAPETKQSCMVTVVLVS
jgi:acyl-CoA synthetase (AMP-forming)/AMP-acid ligase II